MRCEFKRIRQSLELQIRAIFEAGPDELLAAMATLRGKLPDTQTLTVRIDTEGNERIATIIVTTRPDTGDLPTSPMAATDAITQKQVPPTRFRTAEGEPIHEVYIRGNRKITEAEIRAALDECTGEHRKSD